jgi:hypothetical protein
MAPITLGRVGESVSRCAEDEDEGVPLAMDSPLPIALHGSYPTKARALRNMRVQGPASPVKSSGGR